MPFRFSEQRPQGLVLIEPKVFADDRGHFLETYSESGFGANGLPTQFVQINHSRSRRGVLRGLHYQREPMAQGKLVRAVSGEIYDVAVDIRPGSPTRGQWYGVRLSGENNLQLWVPAGFAHGFCVLSDVAEVTYMVTSEYSPRDEGGLLWNDPALNIEWPIRDPIVSPRDLQWPQFSAE